MKTTDTILDRMRRDDPELAKRYDELRERAIKLDDDIALRELNEIIGREYWRARPMRQLVGETR